MRKLHAALLVILLLGCMALPASTYPISYPPHSFGEGPFKRAFTRLLVSSMGKGEYRSSDGQLDIRMDKERFSLDITDGGLKVYSYVDLGAYPPPLIDVYMADLDANGLQDLIIIEHSMQMGSFLEGAAVTLLLKASEGEYRSISYGASFPGSEDFVDIDGDNKSEIIMPGFLSGTEVGLQHNYFTYSVYKIEGFRLENADGRFASFPKFVVYANEANDRDAGTLDQEIRKSLVAEKNRSISYGTIKRPF